MHPLERGLVNKVCVCTGSLLLYIFHSVSLPRSIALSLRFHRNFAPYLILPLLFLCIRTLAPSLLHHRSFAPLTLSPLLCHSFFPFSVALSLLSPFLRCSFTPSFPSPSLFLSFSPFFITLSLFLTLLHRFFSHFYPSPSLFAASYSFPSLLRSFSPFSSTVLLLITHLHRSFAPSYSSPSLFRSFLLFSISLFYSYSSFTFFSPKASADFVIRHEMYLSIRGQSL